MKVPLPLGCMYCGAENGAMTAVGKRFGDWACPTCGRENMCIPDLDFTIGHQILLRARQEHNEKEYWLAMLLAAMAIESELGRLFAKWKSIDAAGNPDVWLEANKKRVSPFEFMARKAEKEFQDSYRGIKRKINEVAKLLDPRGLDGFVQNSEFAAVIQQRYPSLIIGNLAECINRSVFFPRNEIAHLGRAERTEEESARAYSIAALVLGIFLNMDHQRRTGLP